MRKKLCRCCCQLQRLFPILDAMFLQLKRYCRASAIRTEDEIRRMREDALLHARITSPFGTTPTLVESPDLQVDIRRSKILEAEAPEPDKVDMWNKSNLALHPRPTSGNIFALTEQRPSSSQILLLEPAGLPTT